jgi:hypothetical protein
LTLNISDIARVDKDVTLTIPASPHLGMLKEKRKK